MKVVSLPSIEWLVTLNEKVSDADATISDLAARHGFEVSARIDVVRSFVATMSFATVAQLRREPSVAWIYRNQMPRALAG